MVLKIIISAAALTAVVLHMFFPHLTIDAISVALLLVAILPWLASVFDTLEFPGGWKFHFNLQQAARKAETAGLLATPLTKRDERMYSFQMIGESDPNLALAGLRIEIEKSLILLAEKHHLFIKKPSIEFLLELLQDQNLLTPDETKPLKSLVKLLSQAVHGKKIDARGYAWAMDFGPRLLKTLNAKKQNP